MAKSFHTIISEGTLEVDHKGETEVFELPSWLAETSGILMDSEKLTDWAIENEIIHGLLHAGIQKVIIDIRAKCRPGTDVKSGLTKSIVAEKIACQERIDGFVVKPTLPPGSSTPKAFGKGVEAALVMSIEAMQGAGMSDDVILGALSSKFDRAQVQSVLDSLAG